MAYPSSTPIRWRSSFLEGSYIPSPPAFWNSMFSCAYWSTKFCMSTGRPVRAKLARVIDPGWKAPCTIDSLVRPMRRTVFRITSIGSFCFPPGPYIPMPSIMVIMFDEPGWAIALIICVACSVLYPKPEATRIPSTPLSILCCCWRVRPNPVVNCKLSICSMPSLPIKALVMDSR